MVDNLDHVHRGDKPTYKVLQLRGLAVAYGSSVPQIPGSSKPIFLPSQVPAVPAVPPAWQWPVRHNEHISGINPFLSAEKSLQKMADTNG